MSWNHSRRSTTSHRRIDRSSIDFRDIYPDEYEDREDDEDGEEDGDETVQATLTSK